MSEHTTRLPTAQDIARAQRWTELLNRGQATWERGVVRLAGGQGQKHTPPTPLTCDICEHNFPVPIKPKQH